MPYTSPVVEEHVRKSRTTDRGISKDISRLILRITGIFLPVGSGKCPSVLIKSIDRSTTLHFNTSQVTFERAMLNTKIESLFNIYHYFIFFQGICSECRITLGEQVRADSQDPQLIALSESIHKLSLVSTSYFGSLAPLILYVTIYRIKVGISLTYHTTLILHSLF